MLPNIIPNSRIMAYNYDSRWHMDAPKTRLQVCGEELVHSVHRFRNGIDRPIIFIGHSLGGNVIQNALLFADKHDELNYIPSVTVGLTFLGSPFRGSKMQFYANLAVQSLTITGSHGGIIQDLSYDNATLTDRLHAFCNLQRKERMPTSCFYELYETDYGGKIKVPGWVKGMVTSACILGCKRFSLQSDHLALNKFEGPKDRSFLCVSDEIDHMVKDSTDLVQQRKLASSRHQWMVPFGRNRDFTGRESILEQVHRQISPFSDEDSCQRTAIVGLGGVGKTQIALESAYRLRKHCSVFWVPAVDATSFEKAYREIGEKLGVHGINDGKADVKPLVKDALNRDSSGSWLLIIDNADDPDLFFGKTSLSRYLPSSLKGSILFTTRTFQVAQQLDISPGNVNNLGEMSRQESVQLLQKLHPSHRPGHESVETLLDLLVDLPLAIKQAAAYMAGTGISIVQYLHYCRSSDKALARLIAKDFGDQYRYTEIENPIATTWIISFQHIERDKAAAATYLEFMCLLAEREIPLELIPHGDDELDVNEAIGVLKAYALVVEHEEPGFYDIHRLVRLAMRTWMDQKGTLQQYRVQILSRVTAVFPDPEYDNKAVWGRYLPHVEGLLAGSSIEVEASLLSKVGWSYIKLGKYNDAETMLRQALQDRHERLGPEHPDTLDSLDKLGVVLWHRGQYKAAEISHQQAFQGKEKIYGPDHPNTLQSLANLATVLDEQGQYETSDALYQRALQSGEKALGSDHPTTLNRLDNLGVRLQERGKYEEAEQMHRRVLQSKQKMLGPEHPDTFQTLNNLGNVFTRQGHYQEGETMYRQVLQSLEKVLGPEHPDTLKSLHNLGNVLGVQGYYKEAEKIHRQVLQSRGKVLGPEHPDTLESLNSLGLALEQQGQYKEGEQMCRQVIQNKTRIYGPEHPSTLNSMTNLGMILNDQGQYKEAELIYQQAVQGWTKVHGPDHPDTLSTMNNLGVVLKDQGQYEEAELMYRQAVQGWTKVHGPDNPHTLLIVNNLRLLLERQRKDTIPSD
ncbi:TPR-like protein [Aspergillus sclerotiicarbonarius CBS 121057]|uniref:TPR-like protein n=1 Tax=Aspergillus sclerotiicarbonarius (strain CBS 121057 / IBT 28362) TaxID=1448318 RepID=A0A319FLK3_ASPSB|nr:TPR-like protein [Aspergillus sclerotiicarbonarius CBS 121057]